MLGFGHCLTQTNDLVTRLELPALFEKLDALEPLQDVAFYGDSAGALETTMLRHRFEKLDL